MSETTYTPKVGDRVRVTTDVLRDIPSGTEGTITEVIFGTFLFVDLDGYPRPSDEPDGSDGYPLIVNEVEKVA